MIYVLVFRIAAVLSPPTLPRFHLFVFNVLFFILFRIPIRLCPASKSEGEKERKGKERNGMEWNGMEWTGMEWNGMEWNSLVGIRVFTLLIVARFDLGEKVSSVQIKASKLMEVCKIRIKKCRRQRYMSKTG